jgi:hypothetical protein
MKKVRQFAESECDEMIVLEKRLPDIDKVYIYPLCDLHVGDPYFDEKKFRGYLKIIAEVPEAYCIFNGDLINVGLPGGVGAEDFWKQEPLTAQDQNQCIVDMVEEYDIKDKILAIVGGSNHPGRATKLIGHSYDKQFAHDLGLLDRYADPLCVLFLGVGSRKKSTDTHHKGSSIWYSIVITHGTSGGRLAGSSVNATRAFGAIYGTDCVITSHRHLDAVTKDEFYNVDLHNKSLMKIKRMYVSAGTFLGYSAYAQKKGLQPNGTGTPRIRFSGERKDIHVSV